MKFSPKGPKVVVAKPKEQSWLLLLLGSRKDFVVSLKASHHFVALMILWSWKTAGWALGTSVAWQEALNCFSISNNFLSVSISNHVWSHIHVGSLIPFIHFSLPLSSRNPYLQLAGNSQGSKGNAGCYSSCPCPDPWTEICNVWSRGVQGQQGTSPGTASLCPIES